MSEQNQRYPLTAQQIEDYRENGCIRLAGVLAPESVDDFSQTITDVVRNVTPEQRLDQVERDYGREMRARFEQMFERQETAEDSTYSRAFTQIPNLWRYSQAIEKLVRSTRLAVIAADLMSVDGVRLYHDQALYKEAHGGHTPWHVDQFYWPLSSSNTVTAWIPLQPVSMAMGPVAFAKGSHQNGENSIGAALAISDESEASLDVLMQDYAIDESAFAIGDVSFHSGWTCHRAGPNNTDATRAAFTIIYMDRDITMIEPRHRNHQADAAMWLPGINPGEPASSWLNPILFERDVCEVD